MRSKVKIGDNISQNAYQSTADSQVYVPLRTLSHFNIFSHFEDDCTFWIHHSIRLRQAAHCFCNTWTVRGFHIVVKLFRHRNLLQLL